MKSPIKDGKKLTEQDALDAMLNHVRFKGEELHQKYPQIDFATLIKILGDESFVRFPTELCFDSKEVSSGLFGEAKPKSDNKDEGYIIYLHEKFKNDFASLAPMVLYHLVTVNYGDFANFEIAEEFGSSALGIDKEEYYQTLCQLADSIN